MKERRRPRWIWEEPFEEFARIRRELLQPWRLALPVVPEIPVNLSETDKELILCAQLPGFKRDEISVNVTEDRIELAAQKKQERVEKGETFYRREAAARALHRVLSLPVEVDPDKTSAKLEEGILTVTMPKLMPTPVKRARKVEIK